MSQNEAIQLTGLFVIQLIGKLRNGGPVPLTELGEELSKAIAKPAPGNLWLTFGPHASLEEFLFELQALGDVATADGEQVVLTREGRELLAASTQELEDLPAKLGLAA